MPHSICTECKYPPNALLGRSLIFLKAGNLKLPTVLTFPFRRSFLPTRKGFTVRPPANERTTTALGCRPATDVTLARNRKNHSHPQGSRFPCRVLVASSRPWFAFRPGAHRCQRNCLQPLSWPQDISSCFPLHSPRRLVFSRCCDNHIMAALHCRIARP